MTFASLFVKRYCVRFEIFQAPFIHEHGRAVRARAFGRLRIREHSKPIYANPTSSSDGRFSAPRFRWIPRVVFGDHPLAACRTEGIGERNRFPWTDRPINPGERVAGPFNGRVARVTRDDESDHKGAPATRRLGKNRVSRVDNVSVKCD